VNTIKRITIASRAYVVGDAVPFRWFNAGEFGDGALANNDVMNVFNSAVYFLNTPMSDSDLFNAMDSSDGSADHSFGDDVSIDAVVSGDGSLNVDDVWVTFRRSLDNTRKWFARYWSNGALQVVEIPNPLAGGFGGADALPPKAVTRAKSVAHPTAVVTVDDAMTTAGATVEVPVRVSLNDVYAIRTMMLNVTVEALDASPALVAGIQFQKSPAFKDPEFSETRSLGNYSAAWLDASIAGLVGDSILAFVTVRIPANAGPNAAYRVHFDHLSASPNGIALFDVRKTSGLILLSDRSGSTWGDGISDEWKLRYFGSVNSPEAVPAADADADGVLNGTEYANGTDPTDATSY
jgi:hypothetical protein